MSTTEARIDRLEAAVEHFIHSVGVEFNKAYNSNEIFKSDVSIFKDEMFVFKNEMKNFKDNVTVFQNETKDFKDQMKDFKDEMKDFKDEMKDFKDEMKDFKDEMKDFKDEMKDFKDEMKDFKDEMKDFKDEMKDFQVNTWKIVNEMKQQYGDMVRKLGTIVEDLVLPSMPVQIQKKFGFELEKFSINIRLRKDGLNQEYDAIGIYKETVFLNSTKTTLREKNISELKKMIEGFGFWFPEHKGKKLIGILAAFDISDSVKAISEKEGFLVMGVSGNIMELWNRSDFSPKYYTV